jgi:hypothetical protein
MDSRYNRNQKCLLLISVMQWILLTSLFICAHQQAEATNNTSKRAELHDEFLHGTISQNELIDNLERLGIKCIIHEGAAASGLDTLTVEKVRLGGSAYYGGILAGDVIKDLHKLSANTFSLSIERSGKVYQVSLETTMHHQDVSAQANVQKTNLVTGIPKIAIPSSVKKQDTAPIKNLLPYDIELIIDISGSMGFVDGTGDLTKFQWCYEQVHGLAQRLGLYHKTITITTFNTSYETKAGCTADRVEQIYTTIEPDGGTDLVDPLMDRLNNALVKHKSNGHPVLVVVITDGLPNVPADPNVVNQALIDFTYRMSGPDDVVVTILQIGDSFGGRDFCVDLDKNLVNEGAKYGIVDTKPFFQLKHEGLVNAMIEAVQDARDRQLSEKEKHFKRFMNSLPLPSQTVHNNDSKLKERQSERQEIERQLPGQ